MKLKRIKLLLIPIYLIYLFAVIALLFPISKYVLYVPGDINEIKDELVINDKTNNNDFYSVYVIRKANPTLFQLLVGKLNYSTDISDVGESEKDSFLRGQIQEEISFQNALINAYEKAALIDNSINIHYYPKGFITTYSINETIKVGDIFTKLDGIDITNYSSEEFYTYLSNNETINVEIIRNNSGEQVKIKKNESGLFGLSWEKYFVITEATPSYQTFYENDLKGGPSGGFMQTLSIYATLLNYNYNIKIAGTGTMELNGDIGPVGGIKQKILAVNKKVDIFLIPSVHYNEASNAYKKIKKPTFELIEVKNFENAIEILHNYLQ